METKDIDLRICEFKSLFKEFDNNDQVLAFRVVIKTKHSTRVENILLELNKVLIGRKEIKLNFVNLLVQ